MGAWLAGACFLLGLFAALGYLVLDGIPEQFAQTEGLEPKDAAVERGRVRTAALAFLAVAVTAAGAVFTGLTFRLSRRGQATDRFTKAVEQLGHATRDVRLGGIHALGQLALDSRTYRGPVTEVLSAYVREHAKPPPAGTPLPDASPDVQAALTLVTRRRSANDRPIELDLAGTNLCALNLEEAHLRRARFTQAHLRGARLARTDLRDANLVAADLRDADFAASDVTGATFNHARLNGANLSEVVGLEAASLNGATYDSLTTTFPPGFDPGSRGANAAS